MPRLPRTARTLRPIHLLRYGLPAALLVPGVVLIAVGNTRHTVLSAIGLSAVSIAFLVWLTNVFARMSIRSNEDRVREAEARENFARTGSWVDPQTLAATTPAGPKAQPRVRRAPVPPASETPPAPERAAQPSPAPPRQSRPYAPPERVRTGRRPRGGGGGSGRGRRRD